MFKDSEMNLVKKLIENKQCLAIMGPTASGKSQLSMLLAKELQSKLLVLIPH